MGSRYLTDLADVCRRGGYPVVEVDGWQYNARGSGGYDAGYPSHLIIHHTASPASSDPMNGGGDVSYCAYGHEDAPVGNLYLSRDGTIHVMAGGAANTNGTGQDPCGLVPDDGMNSRSIAIEAGNNGVGEPWPTPQQDSYVKLCSNLCLAYGIGIQQIHSHFEWAPGRKIDPAGQSAYAFGSAMWDMDSFRFDVSILEVPEPPQEEDDMLRTVLVPAFAGGENYPYLALFDSGVVRPLASFEPEPLGGKHNLDSKAQYLQLCEWANIKLD